LLWRRGKDRGWNFAITLVKKDGKVALFIV
jgi:hypothetical protein